MRPSIVFDFDGTLAVGHGPVRAYARIAAESAAEGYAERVEAELARYDAGESAYRDGYDIVGSLAADDGVAPEVLEAAYQRSRDALGTPLAPVETADGLDALLTGLGRHARLVLATNAPETGIDRVLRAWGVRDRFDELCFTVGKPAGLTALVARLLEDGPVLAIGDIAEFDLVPALALGADTALVGATAAGAQHAQLPVTMRGCSLAALRTEIETWAATAASSSPAPLGTGTGTER